MFYSLRRTDFALLAVSWTETAHEYNVFLIFVGFWYLYKLTFLGKYFI